MKGWKMRCPTCKNSFKLLIRCRGCGRFNCVECSVKELCIDCFILKRQPITLSEYFEDKYKEKIII